MAYFIIAIVVVIIILVAANIKVVPQDRKSVV